jgi:hypothetical protein
MNNKPEKHLNFFKLTEAFHKSGCPVCSRNEEFASSYIENLLYESVNDAVVRKILRESFGFCKDHAQILLRLGDSLGTAIIYNDLLNNFDEILDKTDYNKFYQRKTCPVCDLVKEHTANNIDTMLNYYDDLEFQNEFILSDGLCARHLIELLKKCFNKEQRTYFIEFHKKRIAELNKDLSELIRKNNYVNHAEKISTDEGKSWIKVLRYLNGYS